MSIRVFTLPGLRIVSPAGEVSALAGRRLPRSLFAYLAVERSASRDTLLALLWPDRDEERGRHSLSQTLYELRRALGESCVLVSGETLSVPAEVETDLARFEAAVAGGQWAAALEQYGGGFLEGGYLASTGAFQEWLERRAAQVARLHRRARREVLAQRLELGDVLGALAVAERWAELEPLEDEAHHRTIELLARLGRRAEALSHYEVFRDRLRRAELEPMPELTQLVASIASAGPPVAAAATTPVATSPVGMPAAAAAPSVTTPVQATSPVGMPAAAGPVEAAVSGRIGPVAVAGGLGLLVGLAAAALAAGLLWLTAAPRTGAGLVVDVVALAMAIALLGLAALAPVLRRRQERRSRVDPRMAGARRLGAGAGFALGVLVTVTGAYVLLPPGVRPAEPSLAWNERPLPDLGPPRRVALTRFHNRSGDLALEPVGRMAEDWIARQLRAIPEADVVADAPPTAADSTPAAVRRLARGTGADLVVFGRYYRDGPDVLMSARLVPVPGGRLPPAMALEEIGPVRAARDEPASGAARLAALVAGAVAAGCIYPECVRGRTPPAYDAWRAWVDAHTALRESHDLAATEAGYRRAIALDTTFVVAFLDLARYYLEEGRCPQVDSLGAALEARTDGVAEYDLLGMRAVGATCRNDRDAAYDDRLRAWQIQPDAAGARFGVAVAAAAAGRLAEAEQELAPLGATRYGTNPGYYFVLLRVLHAQGRYADELRAADEGRARAPCAACGVLFGLAGLAAEGRVPELEARLAQASAGDLREPSIPELYRWTALELEWHGHAEAARRFALRALQGLDEYPDADREGTEYRVRRASVLLQLGRWAEALHALEGVVPAEDAPRVLPLDLTVTKATVLALRGIAAARAGDGAAARSALAAVEQLPERGATAPGVATREVCEAGILAALGDRAEARRRIAFGQARGTVPRLGLEAFAHTEIILRDLWHDPALGAAAEGS